MDEKTYREIWDQTHKAANYLIKKGRMYLTDSVKSGFGVALLTKFSFSDVDEKMKKHVAKTYPRALIEYVDRATVVYGELERQRQFAEYRMNLKLD